MLRLTDSRNRVATGKRYIWQWPDAVGTHAAWGIVLDAEIADPEERESYAGFACHAYASRRSREDCETFNAYWADYGWLLCQYEGDADLWRDEVLMQSNAPATTTHSS